MRTTRRTTRQVEMCFVATLLTCGHGPTCIRIRKQKPTPWMSLWDIFKQAHQGNELLILIHSSIHESGRRYPSLWCKKTCFHRVVDSSETLPHMEDTRRINEYRTTKQNRKKSILMRQTRYLLDTGAGKQMKAFIIYSGWEREKNYSTLLGANLFSWPNVVSSFLLGSFTGSGGRQKRGVGNGNGTFFRRVNPGDLEVRLGVDQPDSLCLGGSDTNSPLHHTAVHATSCSTSFATSTGLEWIDRINSSAVFLDLPCDAMRRA